MYFLLFYLQDASFITATTFADTSLTPPTAAANHTTAPSCSSSPLATATVTTTSIASSEQAAVAAAEAALNGDDDAGDDDVAVELPPPMQEFAHPLQTPIMTEVNKSASFERGAVGFGIQSLCAEFVGTLEATIVIVMDVKHTVIHQVLTASAIQHVSPISLVILISGKKAGSLLLRYTYM